jgi:hypothetical protein
LCLQFGTTHLVAVFAFFSASAGGFYSFHTSVLSDRSNV